MRLGIENRVTNPPYTRMTSVASTPTQTQPDPAKAKLSKTSTTSTTANKFDIPTPEGLTEKDFDDAKTVVGEEVVSHPTLI